MIQDLKADSARWEQERRSHSGGINASRDLPDFLMRNTKSNSPPARYTDSSYRMSGATATTTGSSPYETSEPPYPRGSNRDSYEIVPRYPGNDTPGYSASNVAPPSYPPQQYDNRPYNSQYPQGLGQYPSPQPADVRYSTPGSTQPYSTQPYTNSPVNQAEPPYYNVNSNRITSQQQGGYDQQDPRMVDTSSSRVHPQGTYPGQPQQDPRYYSQGQLPGGNVYSSQSVDPFLGRSNNFPSSQADYTSSAPSVSYQYVTDAPQFESNQTPPPSTSQAQPGHSGSSHSRRDRERDSYSKSSSDRHHRRPPPQ